MSATWHLDEVPMFELYQNINMTPNPFIINTQGDEDSDDDSVFKFPPPKKYTTGFNGKQGHVYISYKQCRQAGFVK